MMALFFFTVGLELKRELLVGELANLKQAILPIVAAIGGMVVPVVVYFSFNPSGHTFDGWGVPMATDIAFALSAVTVIALFYTETLSMDALLIAGVSMVLLLALNLGGIRRPLPYILVGFVLWVAMLESGVHATLAGIFLAFSIPMHPKYEPRRLLDFVNNTVEELEESCSKGELKQGNIFVNNEMRLKIRLLGEG